MVSLVLIGGGHGAGKTKVAKDLSRSILDLRLSDEPLHIECLNMADNLLNDAEVNDAIGPSQFDFDSLYRSILDYRRSGTCDIVIVHGLYALYDDRLLDEAALKIFVDTDADTRLSWKILRDIHKADLNSIIDHYLLSERNEYDAYIQPLKSNADILLSCGSESLGIEVIAVGVLDRMTKTESSNDTPMLNATSLLHGKPSSLALSSPSQVSIRNETRENRFYESG